MNVTPKDFTLHSLLNVPTEQFRIPSYQRRYAWKYGQHRALIEDIDMLLPGDGHLFGMLILHTGYYHGGTNTVDVVDGQQRLTTITILLKVLMNKFFDLKDEYRSGQVGQLLYCGDPKTSNKPKLELGELDNPDYLNLLKGDLEKVKNRNLSDAYSFFTGFIEDAIKDEGEVWLDTFLSKLIHTAKIIRLDVMQAQDAYKLFETINNRGLQLSATDILKNFILGHAAKISEEKLNGAREVWSELIVQLDGIPTDDFFRQYVCGLYTRKISSSKLVEEFKKDYFKKVLEVDKLGEFRYNYGTIETAEFDDESETYDDTSENDNEIAEYDQKERIDILDYIKSILKAATCYSKIWNLNFSDKKINQRIADLQDIRSFPSYIFLMHYLQMELPKKEVYKVLDLIGVTMLRRHVTGQSTAYNDDIFAKLLRVTFDDNHVEDIKVKLNEDTPSDDEFLDSFPRHELKQRVIGRARYILTRIEYFIRKGATEISINGPDEVHVEHIIPQTIDTKTSKAEFGDWESYLGDKARINHKKYVNRIGNMTLLASSLNISASNNPFAKKKGSYKSSELMITKELAEMRDFKFYHMEKRGKELAELAVKIWKL